MRIKFLAIIASFFFVAIAISSCLDSDNNTVELSSDTTVHAFGLDTIYGKHYTFTIDQLKREIYNRDSFPVGADTIIDRILIDTFSVSGWITAGADTLFNYTTDSVNFLEVANKEEGMRFKIHAPDGSFSDYKVKINLHKQDPDSLVWHNLNTYSSTPFSSGIAQKAVVLGDELWIFAENATTAYKTSTKPGEFGWSTVSTNFPTGAKVASIINLKNEIVESQRLYIATSSGKAFSSPDGAVLGEENALGNNVKTLVTSFVNTLVCIVEEGGKNYFKISEDGINWKEQAVAVPDDFPLESIYTTPFSNPNGLPQMMLVGKPESNAKKTASWFTMNGIEWVKMVQTSYDTYCPAMNNPVCMYYGGTFYIFGSKDMNKLDAIYSSVAGLAWFKTEKKFLLPQEDDFKSMTSPYSIAIDNLNYIWVIFGGDGMQNAVWRGRLNKLGFSIQ